VEDRQHLFVRVDASPSIGTGHFVRCFSLAQHWRDEVGKVTFVGTLPEALGRGLEAEEIECVSPGAARIPAAAPLVVDGYDFRAEELAGLRARPGPLLFVDDNRHLDRYEVDWLLNANPHAEDLAYGDEMGGKLLGPRFALFRRDLRRAAQAPREYPGRADRLLLTCGGADPRNDTLELLAVLDALDLKGAELRVVVGPLNPHFGVLAEHVAARAGSIELLRDPEVPALLAWADLAIASSGSGALELALFGLPSLTVAIAGNQEAGGRSLAARGTTRWLGRREELEADGLRSALRELREDRTARRRMGESGRRLIDGRGVGRVARVLLGPPGSD